MTRTVFVFGSALLALANSRLGGPEIATLLLGSAALIVAIAELVETIKPQKEIS
ncbi:MAG: hypothetical protein QM705_06310 [Ancrocorticia sp.]